MRRFRSKRAERYASEAKRYATEADRWAAEAEKWNKVEQRLKRVAVILGFAFIAQVIALLAALLR